MEDRHKATGGMYLSTNIEPLQSRIKKEPIMTERQYCDKHEGNASGYLSYCRGQGKNYHY